MHSLWRKGSLLHVSQSASADASLYLSLYCTGCAQGNPAHAGCQSPYHSSKHSNSRKRTPQMVNRKRLVASPHQYDKPSHWSRSHALPHSFLAPALAFGLVRILWGLLYIHHFSSCYPHYITFLSAFVRIYVCSIYTVLITLFTARWYPFGRASL